MNKKFYFKVKVYKTGKGAGIYPIETYEKDDYADASMLYNAMMELEPYLNKRIEIVRYVVENGKMVDFVTLQKNA